MSAAPVSWACWAAAGVDGRNMATNKASAGLVSLVIFINAASNARLTLACDAPALATLLRKPSLLKSNVAFSAA